MKLFAIAILYIISRWILSFINRKSLQAIANAEGDFVPNAFGCCGSLVHRYIRIEKTISGKLTDVKFHYVESADRERECIVFLHGLMDTWRLWQHQLEFLSDRYYAIAFDLKGCGQSSMNYPRNLFPEVNDPGGDYSLEMQADEIVTALETLGIKQFNLVALDLGTIISDILAGKYSDRILRYIRCQQPLVGHFRSSIPQGAILRRKRGARMFAAMLESDPSILLRILYGRTGWSVLDRQMKRTKQPLPDSVLASAVLEASHAFQWGPRTGKPGIFAGAWAGLYQHNRDYGQFVQNNLQAYQNYAFPVFLFQGIHDIAMPPERFDGTTGMAFKVVRSFNGTKTLLSRAFDRNGIGLGDGYEPWGTFIPGCDRPMQAQEFFPNAPSVALEFFDTGHFIPLENPELFTDRLVKALNPL
ncbi:alpha/beta fold hydrolase [Pseudanabaena sp. PCC 6802]|uniref:alpha/beta fold hydrolase n=1 Tax=Pseudanabaena sp. PCC 6802 TaxID=118173 RepID=UPI000360B31D|nr:alpha/beta fold hydrolase [Pseudanabaena sp. PCC 6802]